MSTSNLEAVGDHIMRNDELSHHGILGQKWGIRRFRDKYGALTQEGKERYSDYYRAGQRKAAELFFIKKKVDKALERKEEKEKEASQDPTAKTKEFIKSQGINKLKAYMQTDKGKETIRKGSDALTKISSSVIKKGYQVDPYIRKGTKKAYEIAKKGAKAVAKSSAENIKKYGPVALNAALNMTLSASKYASEYAAKSEVLINDAAKKSARLLKVASNTGSEALHTILKMRKAG